MNERNETGGLSSYFLLNIKKAIELFDELEGTSTDEEVLQAFYENDIDRFDAIKIIIFLPIAFCRRLLPDLKWRDEYFESDRFGKTKEMKFSQTTTYTLIWEEVSKYFSIAPQKDVIIKIAGRSSEFHAISDLLNAGGKLEDIKLTPMQIIW